MTNRGVAVLALRLFALFLFVHSLLSLPELLLQLRAHPDEKLLFALHLLPLLLAVLIWSGVGRLVGWMLPQRVARAESPPPNLEDVQSIAFASVGLLLLGLALPRLLPLLYTGAEAWLRAGVWTVRGDWEEALVTVAQVLLGVVLLLGGRGLSGAILSLRRAGVHA